MTKELKAGDLVELKSGGPVMTVNTVFGDGDVSCAWFAGEKQQSHIFSEHTLKLAGKADDPR